LGGQAARLLLLVTLWLLAVVAVELTGLAVVVLVVCVLAQHR
jgi:hypothetical protein